jgi:hypothetical protein
LQGRLRIDEVAGHQAVGYLLAAVAARIEACRYNAGDESACLRAASIGDIPPPVNVFRPISSSAVIGAERSACVNEELRALTGSLLVVIVATIALFAVVAGYESIRRLLAPQPIANLGTTPRSAVTVICGRVIVGAPRKRLSVRFDLVPSKPVSLVNGHFRLTRRRYADRLAKSQTSPKALVSDVSTFVCNATTIGFEVPYARKARNPILVKADGPA